MGSPPRDPLPGMGAVKPNWLAIWAILIFLVTTGFLLGLLSAAPDGQTLYCPEEDMVQIVGLGEEELHRVLVYCEE